MFETRDIVEGVKFSDHLYKISKRESAGSAVVGLATALVRACRELKIQRGRLVEIVEQIDNSMNVTENDHATAAQRGVSRLFIP